MASNAKKRAYHTPQGDPCTYKDPKTGEVCGLPAAAHYPSHKPRGYPVCDCGAPWENHKVAKEKYFAGIDGEGVGREDHRYTLLAWSSADGKQSGHIEEKPGLGLSTVECLDFILGVPKRAQLFAFSFGYDLTKILADLPNSLLFMLARPELRPNPNPKNKWAGPRPIVWKGYRLNLIASKFVIQKGKKRVVIWDTFKFFQSKFTKALTDWKVADPEHLQRMGEMKELRGEFDKQTSEQIREYCLEECRYMAALAEKLVNAHKDAGLKLRQYFGAGSSAAAILKTLGIDKETRIGPEFVEEAAARCFSGGRFEMGFVGLVEKPVYNDDLSSAYPYWLTQMPCLSCGKWYRTTRRKDLETADLAAVHYALGDAPKGIKWGPFPFRTKDGSIVYAAESGGGWVWKKEFEAAERIFPHVHFREAYVYRADCDCKTCRPFARIPEFYRERLRIGKEGPGLAIKLAINACYGRLAQRIGEEPPFLSAIWAGNVTSGTRANILDFLGRHKDMGNVLAIATDGVASLENVVGETPIDTDTAEIYGADQDKPKPLGGWEKKREDNGMFFARPGIYFPRVGDTKDFRARGIGRRSLYENRQKVIDAWQAGEKKVELGNVVRFHGMKSSIHHVWETKNGKQEPRFKRSDDYGQWRTKKIEMTFDPMPKREGINPDGTLQIRYLPRDVESAPYNPGVLSGDALMMRLAALEMMEQPDGFDFSMYDYE